MGYYTRENGRVKCYTPDSTPETLYIRAGSDSMASILTESREHFGNDVQLEDIMISCENIRTDCLTYDQYDPMDYTDYFVITLKDPIQ